MPTFGHTRGVGLTCLKLQDAAERVPKPSHQGFDDIQQALVKTRQTEGGTDDTVMQSAVSVCEGALGILKAALAGTLTGQHPVRHYLKLDRSDPGHYTSQAYSHGE